MKGYRALSCPTPSSQGNDACIAANRTGVQDLVPAKQGGQREYLAGEEPVKTPRLHLCRHRTEDTPSTRLEKVRAKFLNLELPPIIVAVPEGDTRSRADLAELRSMILLDDPPALLDQGRGDNLDPYLRGTRGHMTARDACDREIRIDIQPKSPAPHPLFIVAQPNLRVVGGLGDAIVMQRAARPVYVSS
jgi:hypothetical protein